MSSVVQSRPLGDRRVFPVAFGAMNLSIEGRPSRADALSTIEAALDAGVTLFDTADVYGHAGQPHHNEALLGHALQGRDVTIATKGGVVRCGDRWEHRGGSAHLRAACERSLIALGIDCIGLYQLHAVDETIPIEQSLATLERLRDEGKIRDIGVSNVSADQLERALRVSSIVSVQNEASIFVAPDPRVLELCQEHGLALLAYAPSGGWRAGRVAHEQPLQEIASAHDASPFEVGLAWLLASAPSLIAVCGASRPSNARSSASAATLRLTDDELAKLTQAYR